MADTPETPPQMTDYEREMLCRERDAQEGRKFRGNIVYPTMAAVAGGVGGHFALKHREQKSAEEAAKKAEEVIKPFQEKMESLTSKTEKDGIESAVAGLKEELKKHTSNEETHKKLDELGNNLLERKKLAAVAHGHPPKIEDNQKIKKLEEIVEQYISKDASPVSIVTGAARPNEMYNEAKDIAETWLANDIGNRYNTLHQVATGYFNAKQAGNQEAITQADNQLSQYFKGDLLQEVKGLLDSEAVTQAKYDSWHKDGSVGNRVRTMIDGKLNDPLNEILSVAKDHYKEAGNFEQKQNTAKQTIATLEKEAGELAGHITSAVKEAVSKGKGVSKLGVAAIAAGAAAATYFITREDERAEKRHESGPHRT